MSPDRCPNDHPPGYRVNENDEKMLVTIYIIALI